MDIQDFKKTRFNVLGVNSKMTGEIHFDGPTTLCGEMQGTIFTTSRLVLDRNSRMVGTIRGHDVEITGHFEGEIECTGTLALKAGSEVSARIKATNLVVYPGAVVNMDTTDWPASAGQ